MNAKTMEKVVDGLFPTHPIREETYSATAELGEITLLNKVDVVKAAENLRNKKSPWPDGIPAENLKVILAHLRDVQYLP